MLVVFTFVGGSHRVISTNRITVYMYDQSCLGLYKRVPLGCALFSALSGLGGSVVPFLRYTFKRCFLYCCC